MLGVRNSAAYVHHDTGDRPTGTLTMVDASVVLPVVGTESLTAERTDDGGVVSATAEFSIRAAVEVALERMRSASSANTQARHVKSAWGSAVKAPPVELADRAPAGDCPVGD